MKNTKTKSIVALAIVLVLTVVFGIVGVTGMSFQGGLWKLLPWLPTTNADAWPQAISLGLDLRGGVYVEYSAEAPEGNDANFSDLLDATVSAIQSRLTDKGYAESTVQVLGTSGIRVEIPDVSDPSEILNLIGEPALLEFKDPDGNTFMTGSDVRLAQAAMTQDGQWAISFQLTSAGTKLFADMTSQNIGKTLGIYLSTTVFAIVIGLVVVNLIRPGEVFPREKTTEFRSRYEQSVSEKATAAENMREDSPLQFLVDMVPENVVRSAGDNSAMLQIVLLSIAFGIAMVAVGRERADPVKKLVESLNEIILKIIGYVMKLAPLGVMALMADLIVGFAGDSDLLLALGYYALTVVIGLCVILLICYPLIIRFFTDIRLPDYVRAVLPVQMLAFTSCSSAACLPVNIEQMRRLGLPHNVISFVLPTGVTVNMNGTSCYHAIATVFVAQVMGIELSLAQMLSIVVLTTVSSIGTPGIPSGGMAVLTLVLVSVGIPAEGIAMIIAMDRPLDMLITAVNVSGDAMAACVVSRGERSESAETVISAHTNTEQS